MERIEAFEAMLKAALDQSEAERRNMEELKAQGKEKLRPIGSIWAIACSTINCLHCAGNTA